MAESPPGREALSGSVGATGVTSFFHSLSTFALGSTSALLSESMNDAAYEVTVFCVFLPNTTLATPQSRTFNNDVASDGRRSVPSHEPHTNKGGGSSVACREMVGWMDGRMVGWMDGWTEG